MTSYAMPVGGLLWYIFCIWDYYFLF